MLDGLFDSATALTPHGFCLTWQPALIGLHAGADAVIGLSYFSIPLALAALWRRRPDLEFGWLLCLFAIFILACGTTHFMSIVTLWVPAYTTEGMIKLATAIVSVATAILLWPLLPRLVAIPSPRALRILNDRLVNSLVEQENVTARLRGSEEAVRLANVALESRVAERTAALSEANERLRDSLAARDEALHSLGEAKTALEAAVLQARYALTQRDLLLREVYHRVKNNLQMIDGMLFMEGSKLADPVSKAALAGLHDRIYALALIHQQLMTSDDLETFDLAPFLSELTASMAVGVPAYDRRIAVHSVPLRVGLDTAIPLGLLVTELVTKALQRALKDEGALVAVDLTTARDGTYSLAVETNNDAAAARRADEAMPRMAEDERTRIIRGLASQIDAELTETSPSRTELRFRLHGTDA